MPERAAFGGGVHLLPDDPHDRELVTRVHPPGWVNPRPAPRYNLVVLGAGTAGLVAAAGAAGFGARVALVERGLMGGDCLNVGCVPSKALLRSARAWADLAGAAEHGIHVPPGARLDFARVMERMRALRARLAPNDSAERFRALGVDVFLGEARFLDPRTVEVGGARLRFARALIATGARPADPGVPGLESAGCLTNETMFALTELPPRLAIVGGGPIGCEMAQAFARFGSHVTLLERGPRLLARDDADGARLVQLALERDGVRVRLATAVSRAERPVGPGAGVRLRLEGAGGAGAPEEVEADRVLVAAGRAPNVEDLGLEAAGVAYDLHGGVRVDDALRTTSPRVYAAGDVCSAYRFTHLSDAMARIVVRNALFPGRTRASALTLPWCTYTDPELAHVGLDPARAAERGLRTRTLTQELEGVDRAVLDGETAGFVRVHVRARGDGILGATVVARHAGDLIAELALAITAGAGLRRIAETIHPYPTRAEAVRKVADAWNRSRLTPRARRLLERWMRWTR